MPPGCPALVSINELATWLGLSTSYLYKLTCRRQIPYLKIGARVVFDTEQIKLWLKEKSVEPIYAKKRRSQ